MATPNNYNADTIEALEFPICVQRRPSMYIGGTNQSGANHCFYEILDNSVDEAGAGYCSEIIIQLFEDGGISVTDNGRGIPVDIHKDTNKSALELVFCTLHAGGKFNEKAYAGMSGGLNGVGASCVNALSNKFIAVVKRDGKFYGLRCENGFLKTPVQELKDKPNFPKHFKSGTKVYYTLNTEIFQSFQGYDADLLKRRVKQAAFLNPGLKITLIRVDGKEESFLYPEGIKQYVQELNKNKKVVHEDPFFCSEEVQATHNGKEETYKIDVAFQYNETYNEEIIGFANNISTPNGGTHISTFKRVLTKTFNNYANTNSLLKTKDPDLTGDDYREGLMAIVSVKLPNIEFEGQTKGALNNESIKKPLEQIFTKRLEFFLDANPSVAKIVIERAIKAAKVREAARKIKDEMRKKNSALDGIVVNKLKDCRSKKPEETEIYIVEGDSAGSNAVTARDSYFQAVLPLRGKVLNTYNIPRAKIYRNNEIANLLKALDIDFDLPEEENLRKLRYHKIILLADADPDGQHIECLLLTFFYCHARFLIEHGHIYVAEPPLYKATYKRKSQYIADDAELEEFKKENGITYDKELQIKRFKGLGEMNAEELEETSFNLENRSLKQITIEDLEQAADILDIFLGPDSSKRREVMLNDINGIEEEVDILEDEEQYCEIEEENEQYC